MHFYFRLVCWAACKVPDVSSVGPLPFLTLPFWISIRRDPSLTTVRGCGCSARTPVRWSVPHADAHSRKKEAWLRSAAVQDWGKRKGNDALRRQLPTIDPTVASMPSYLPFLYRYDAGREHSNEELHPNSPSGISLATSKMPPGPWPQGCSSVKSFQPQVSFSDSQERCLVIEGSSGSYNWSLLWEMQVHTGF